MRFAKYTFRIAGVWGVVFVLPLYFMFDTIGTLYPPALTHPDFYFGFVGVTLAWQASFLLIATDPIRYRPIMVAGILEKFLYVLSIAVLYAQGRVQLHQLEVAAPDLVLGTFFVLAYLKTSAQGTDGQSEGTRSS